MQTWSTLLGQQLSAFTQRNFATKTAAGLQSQSKGCETHLKSLIFHQLDPLKDCL